MKGECKGLKDLFEVINVPPNCKAREGAKVIQPRTSLPVPLRRMTRYSFREQETRL
jgi:hypothetical protein